MPPYSKVFIANFEHVFVTWDFISHEKSVTGVCRRIIYKVVGVAPKFLSDKMHVCFTQGYVCFIPFQSVKQTHGIFHLLLNKQAVILCLCVQVGSKVLPFQKKVFSARIILYPIIKSFLNLHMFHPIWLYFIFSSLVDTLLLDNDKNNVIADKFFLLFLVNNNYYFFIPKCRFTRDISCYRFW